MRSSVSSRPRASGVALLLVVGVGAFSGLARGASSPGAAQLLRTALRDAEARGSAHATEVITTSGVRILMAVDASLRDGSQQITAPDIGVARILVVDGDAYCSGSTLYTLPNYCDITAAAARIVGKRWIRIPPSSSAYSGVASGVTLPSALEIITPAGKLVEEPAKTIDGVRAIGISGTAINLEKPFTSVTVWITTSQPSLPLAATFTSSISRTTSGTLSLGDWGEHVAVSPPTGSIDYASLPGSRAG